MPIKELLLAKISEMCIKKKIQNPSDANKAEKY